MNRWLVDLLLWTEEGRSESFGRLSPLVDLDLASSSGAIVTGAKRDVDVV